MRPKFGDFFVLLYLWIILVEKWISFLPIAYPQKCFHSTQEYVDKFARDPPIVTAHNYTACMYIRLPANICLECFDDVVHFAGFFEIVFDFVDGMQDSRVVTGENLADFR